MISREGSNCWCKPHATKVSFLVDAADYFEAFVRAVHQARRSIHIAGWDIDSRLILDRRNRFDRRIPPLGDFLNQAVEANPSLQVYILIWDFPAMYLRERQFFPRMHLEWKTHRRVHFQFDSEHPIGASQHEKFVVVDDHLAFCGGLDLTKNRWDTPSHRVEDSRRADADGNLYGPFHDTQIAVEGEAARVLGMHFRSRWKHAGGGVLPIPKIEPGHLWPSGLEPDVAKGCQIAIARTTPTYKNREKITEVQQLYVDAIHAAKHRIYIENQYLTAKAVCSALGERLARDIGPEIVIVLPQKASGWLEQSTMDAIRSHQLGRLVEHDRNKRLGVYYPVVGDQPTPVYIHSKVMVVDDRFAIAGSANLSNRSMGLDSECCLAVESAPDSKTAAAIARFRRRLMAEHLGVAIDELASAEQHQGSWLRLIESLKQPHRGLRPLDIDAEPVVDGTDWVPDQSFLDPEEPIVLDLLLDQFAKQTDTRTGSVRPYLKIVSMLLFFLALAALWRWTPLSQWLTSENLAQWADRLDTRLSLIAAVLGGYMIGGLAFIPITLMIGATALLFPAWLSFACALAGAVLNAWVTYLAGRWMGERTVRKLAGKRLQGLNNYLARRGILTMAVVRNVPVAPYTIVNIVAGTSGIKLSDFLLGTALGMSPGILFITVFTERTLEVFKEPSWINIGLAMTIAAVVGLGWWWLKNRLRQKN